MPLKFFSRTPNLLLLTVAAGLVVILGGLFWLLLDRFQPLPPRTITMATGPQGGAYHAYGERYRDLLAREGFDLQLLSTSGAVENLQKLSDSDSKVGVGFVQGGLAGAVESATLKSLGTVFYEPLWFFCNHNRRERGLPGLRGRRIGVGPVGSGTQSLVLQLLAKNGVTPEFAELLPLSFQEGSEKLLVGEIDAMFVVASWQSPVVRRLLAADGIDLLSFPHTDAYVALFPFLSKLVVPAGLGDMVMDRPPKDTPVLAAKASLVVRNDTHPALHYLLLETAAKIHAESGVFHKAGQFPAAESSELVLSDEARRYYRFGPPFLQRYLPFWLAILIGRVFIILLPVIGLLLPLMRFVPALYDWKMRRRIFKLYHELKAIELACESGTAVDDTATLSARLNRLEHKADHLWVPVSSMSNLYMFKEHIALVRQRLEHPAQDS